MREIQRRLDHYIALREFLCVKGQKRILKDLEEKERLKKEMQEKELEDQLEMYENTLKQIQVTHLEALYLEVISWGNSSGILPRRKRGTHRCYVSQTRRGKLRSFQLRK